MTSDHRPPSVSATEAPSGGYDSAPEPASEVGLPGRTQVLIVGGGIIGCSVAYHLTKRGITDVTIIEQGSLTSGTVARCRACFPAQTDTQPDQVGHLLRTAVRRARGRNWAGDRV